MTNLLSSFLVFFLLFSCVESGQVADTTKFLPEVEESEAFESEAVELAFEFQEDDTFQFTEEKKDKLREKLDKLFRDCSEDALKNLEELLVKIDEKVLEIETKLTLSRLEEKEYKRLNKMLAHLEKFEEKILQTIEDCKNGVTPERKDPLLGRKLTCDQVKKLKEKLLVRKEKLLEKVTTDMAQEKLEKILEKLESKLEKIEEKLKDC